ncbi:M56 family metallopeptidase [Metabacillus malikii]|uniref:Zn-dependent protease with chaperone function n=1 Tax=Metabacillus malikii TaxID=1504265 RepID=A0ABT9ZCM9_9BACI|nr:M56 family metallopeptidase [Metabacillus malikii]MDQ0230009.1 Zn-dependent protease with chaperone function [Metabacillus malikii]
MFETFLNYLIVMILGVMLHYIGMLSGRINKKLGYFVEILCGLLTICYIFYVHSFPDGFTYFGLLAYCYASAIELRPHKTSYNKVKEQLIAAQVEEMQLFRDKKRVVIDVLIFFVTFAFAILFLIYGPKESSILKYIITLGFITFFTELVKRIHIAKNVKCYYDHDNAEIFILSKYESRKIPVIECINLQLETSVDILKLHPLFTLFTSNVDFTTSNRDVLKIEMPGETLYLTLNDSKKWVDIFSLYMKNQPAETMNVLPFYHKKNIKRLIGKLYFATTVKGVSAYSALLLILYFLQVPTWGLVLAGISYWILNIMISDVVLKVAMDAKAITNQEIISVADPIFKKAGLSNVKLYETESSDYNGLATGMNIGRGMITLTSQTLKLPLDTIEGIIAHESIHLKKRDIMWTQIWRICFLLILLVTLIPIIQNIDNIESLKTPLFLLIWLLMMIFPTYLSFVSQWMEVRADHLGGELLKGGHIQMANSLRTLTIAQDNALNKSLEYQMLNDKDENVSSSLERESWILRIISFQFMPHPPMYWRVQTLQTNKDGWGKGILKQWLRDRWKETVSKK